MSAVPAMHALWCDLGRVVAQAVSHWLPTAADLVRALVRSSGICGGQSSIGTGFLRVLRFPLPVIPTSAPHSSISIIRGWYNRPSSGDVPSGLSLIPSQVKKRKAIPVTGHGSLYDCLMSRIPYCPCNLAHRLRLGCQPYVPAALYPRNIFRYSFLLGSMLQTGRLWVRHSMR
jgi:hypothetical protein